MASPWQQDRENSTQQESVKTEEEEEEDKESFFSQDGEREKRELEGAAAACFHSNVDAGQEKREGETD